MNVYDPLSELTRMVRTSVEVHMDAVTDLDRGILFDPKLLRMIQVTNGRRTGYDHLD